MSPQKFMPGLIGIDCLPNAYCSLETHMSYTSTPYLSEGCMTASL
jgi:hypothetical protein